MEKLNENELKVLNACKDAIIKETECEFGRLAFVKVDCLNDNQLKGYLSQLVQKEYIEISECSFHNIKFFKKSNDLLGTNFETVD
jgi:hypothetical protein